MNVFIETIFHYFSGTPDITFYLINQLQPTLDDKKGTASGNSLRGSESQHLAVELADWKAKLRKQRQEL